MADGRHDHPPDPEGTTTTVSWVCTGNPGSGYPPYRFEFQSAREAVGFDTLTAGRWAAKRWQRVTTVRTVEEPAPSPDVRAEDRRADPGEVPRSSGVCANFPPSDHST